MAQEGLNLVHPWDAPNFPIRWPVDGQKYVPADFTLDNIRSKADILSYQPNEDINMPKADRMFSLAGSIVFRGQTLGGADGRVPVQWDDPKQRNFFNYTFFPAVFTDRKTKTKYAKPYMVVYAARKPDPVVVGHIPMWQDIIVGTTGVTIHVDSAMISGGDAQKSIVSAINLTKPCQDSYLWFTRAFDMQFSPQEGWLAGPSMGLAVAACIVGAPPVTYTGFTRNLVVSMADPRNPSSANTVWNKASGEVDAVSKLSDIVEEVQELGPKIVWALRNKQALVIPHTSNMGVAIKTIINNTRYISSWALPELSRLLYSTAELNAGIPLESANTVVMIASTVTDAVLLATLAWTQIKDIALSAEAKKFAEKPTILRRMYTAKKNAQAFRRNADEDNVAFDLDVDANKKEARAAKRAITANKNLTEDEKKERKKAISEELKAEYKKLKEKRKATRAAKAPEKAKARALASEQKRSKQKELLAATKGQRKERRLEMREKYLPFGAKKKRINKDALWEILKDVAPNLVGEKPADMVARLKREKQADRESRGISNVFPYRPIQPAGPMSFEDAFFRQREMLVDQYKAEHPGVPITEEVLDVLSNRARAAANALLGQGVELSAAADAERSRRTGRQQGRTAAASQPRPAAE